MKGQTGGQTTERRRQTDMVKAGKVHPCIGTEALYRPYGP